MDSTPPTLLQKVCQTTDQDAWSRFTQLYTPLLLHWARQQGLKGADAADLVQEVFVVLVKKMPEFRYDPAKKFRSWLHTILLNKWKNARRRFQPTIDFPNEPASPPDQPDDFLNETEYQKQLLVQAMNLVRADFQPQTWTAFLEHAVHGKPGPQVASNLGLSLNAVYSAKFRILQRLRQELSGFFD